MIIRCSEDANDHTIHKFSLSVVVLIIIGCVFLPAGKKTHVLKVTNFMNNLKNTELLTFLYMFRSFKPGFIIVSTENYKGMPHIKEKNNETDKSCTMTSILRICFYYS